MPYECRMSVVIWRFALLLFPKNVMTEIIRLILIVKNVPLYFWYKNDVFTEPFHDGGNYHIETSPLICSENRWTGFYMIGSSAMKELKITSININESKNFSFLCRMAHFKSREAKKSCFCFK